MCLFAVWVFGVFGVGGWCFGLLVLCVVCVCVCGCVCFCVCVCLVVCVCAPQGGSVFSPSLLLGDAEAQAQAQLQALALARQLDCPTSDPNPLMFCLRAVPARVLNAAQTKVGQASLVQGRSGQSCPR